MLIKGLLRALFGDQTLPQDFSSLLVGCAVLSVVGGTTYLIDLWSPILGVEHY